VRCEVVGKSILTRVRSIFKLLTCTQTAVTTPTPRGRLDSCRKIWTRSCRPVTKWPDHALFPENMRPSHTIRSRAVTHSSPPHARRPIPGLGGPGAFQCAVLRAFELPKRYRDVFLLKEIQGYKLAEIAAILGISIDTALERLKSAHREIGHLGDSDAMEHAE
jgi:DNA-directed RNA polymerase specialized sigma24 family protein